jgi:hypothetical protein
MEKSTIPSGFTATHAHSGLLGQSPASWPMTVVFGQPTVLGRGQCTWRGIEFYDTVVGYRRQGLHLDHPHGSSY